MDLAFAVAVLTGESTALVLSGGLALAVIGVGRTFLQEEQADDAVDDTPRS